MYNGIHSLILLRRALSLSSRMLLDAVRPLETPVNVYQTAPHHIPMVTAMRTSNLATSFSRKYLHFDYSFPYMSVNFLIQILTKSTKCLIRCTCKCDVTKSSPHDGAQQTSLGVLEETSCLISCSRNSCASIGIMTFGPPNLCGLQPQLTSYCVCRNAKECCCSKLRSCC